MKTTRYPLEGNGTVLRDAEAVASVHYTLYVTQELMETGKMAGRTGLVKRVSGEIQVTRGDALPISQPVKLVLEDGRDLDFKPMMLIDATRRAYSFVIMSNMQSLGHQIY